MEVLKVLSAGAAETLLRTLVPQFETANACHIESEFGNAGVIAGKLRAQQAADLVILPEKQIGDFGRSAIVLADTIAALGKVGTALAVPRGQPVPSLHGVNGLRRALLNAAHLYAPEWRNATAGIHFKAVLERLGIWEEIEPRLKTFPNGAASMKALACASGSCIGCTQATEIFGERGVTFAGYLPDEFKLETVYSAGVCGSAADETLARKFVWFITGEASRSSRAAAGFL
ncbi:MAG: substrate-binding domain-containing protein [Methylobacteriaceae bacterium]|nr:substrate-binding domain-containing protein [Methylobacteriaceae bacterium]